MTHPYPGNSSNIYPISSQAQLQMGSNNPQNPFFFNNSTTQLNNGQPMAMPNMPSLIPQPSFMNFSNQLLPFPSHHLVSPQFASTMQCPAGFGPQNIIQNVNNASTSLLHRSLYNLATNANQGNPPQPPGHFLMHNTPVVPQQFYQNMGVTYGQLQVQTPLQHMNQLSPMQMPNPTQVGSCNSISDHASGFPNQMSNVMGFLNPSLIANLQLGMVQSTEVGQHANKNLQDSVQPSVNTNASQQLHTATQHSKGNFSTPNIHHSVQSQQSRNNLQHSVLKGSQGNHVEYGGNNYSNFNGRKPARNNFNGHQKNEMPHRGFQKSQFRNMKNGKRNPGGSGENWRKGVRGDRSGIYGNSTNPVKVQEKRPISLNYTEQEVQQWREERRKNYPSKGNLEKKLADKLAKSDVINREAVLRRKQLKEILAKQAELGVEVAEVPSHYLFDSENQLQGTTDNRRAPYKNERFQNKGKKRGRYDKRDRFAKKRNLAVNDLSKMPSFATRKPTLLQKLLSADIKRDKSHMLQVFRFMVMNSFFKHWPEKPLEFPVVTVRDGGCEGEVVEEKSSLVGKDAFEAIEKSFIEEIDNEEDDDDKSTYDNDKNYAQVKVKASCFDDGNKSVSEENKCLEEEDEEEGEIID